MAGGEERPTAGRGGDRRHADVARVCQKLRHVGGLDNAVFRDRVFVRPMLPGWPIVDPLPIDPLFSQHLELGIDFEFHEAVLAGYPRIDLSGKVG